MKKPYVSAVMICGDEGAKTLGRCLKSLLDRPGGPLVDEIVIGWNGADRALFERALSESGFSGTTHWQDGVLECSIFGGVCLRAFDQKWTDDFAAARNEAHARATGTWHIYIDADDVVVTDDPEVDEELRRAGVQPTATTVDDLRPTLAEYLRAREAEGRNMIMIPYHYVVDGENRPLQRQVKARIVKWGDGWVWRDRIHESMYPTFGNKPRPAVNPGFLLRHLPSQDVRERLARNARIARESIEEAEARGEEVGYRDWYNLGAIAFDDREWDRAVSCLLRCVALSEKAQDYDQMLVALDYTVRALLALGRSREAIQAAFEMLRIAANRPEGYVALIQAHYMRGEWSAVARWFDTFQMVKSPAVVSVENVIERTAWPMAWAAEALVNLGYNDRALELAKRAVTAAPEDIFCRRALEQIEWVKAQVDALVATETLVRFHLRSGDTQRAYEVLTAGPQWEDDRFKALRAEVDMAMEPTKPAKLEEREEVKAWAERVGVDPKEIHAAQLGPQRSPIVGADVESSEEILEREIRVDEMDEATPGVLAWHVQPACEIEDTYRHITIYAPIHNEAWTPEQARTKGLGGSEEAIVYVAEELSRRGHGVTVYGPSLSNLRVRVVKGVKWRKYTDFDPRARYDVLIGHRAPWLAQENPNAEVLLSWHHDHKYHVDAWHSGVADKSFHMFVSEWQGRVLAGLVPGVTIRGGIIGNGVPTEQILPLDESQRVPHRVIYASQPIRGLARLLEIWPEIMEIYPNAELHTFYGFHTNRFAGEQVPEVWAQVEEVEALLTLTKGVVDHGRVGQIELMAEMRKASVWAYPSVVRAPNGKINGFPEVSCITGLRAAAAGCIPVFTSHNNALGETQPTQQYAIAEPWETGGGERFRDALIRAMADTGFAREELRQKVLREHTWTAVTDRVLQAIEDASTLRDAAEAS